MSKENKTEHDKKCGLRLKECRKEKKLTQKELAEMVGYTTQQISNYERGKRGLQSYVNALADALGVPANYLLCKIDYKTPFDQYRDELNTQFTKDELLVQLLRLLGHSIEYKDNIGESFPSVLGNNTKTVTVDGIIMDKTDYYHMAEDIFNYINFIVGNASNYTERHHLHLAMKLSEELNAIHK